MSSRLSSLLLALMAAATIGGVFLGTTPLAMKAAIAAAIALAIWRPGDGLVVVAAFAPLGGALAALSHATRSWTLPLVCALLVGVAIREAIQPHPTRDRVATLAVAVWVAIVLLSLALEVASQRPTGQPVSLFLGHFLTWLVRKFPMVALRDYPSVNSAALACAGTALFAVTATLCRRDSSLAIRVVGALIVSVAALGALNVNRLIEAALRRPRFLPALVELHQTTRINTTFPDLNAAGAVFVLMLPIAIALVSVHRTRWLAWTAVPLLLAGAWLAGSRTALVALPMSVAMLVISRARLASWHRLGLAVAFFIGIIGLSVLVVLAYPRTAAHGSIVVAFGVRQDLVTTTLRMARAAPLLGVGIGRYYDRSTQFMPPRLRRQYRAQNAHNQFLQVLGELGVVGLAAFAMVIGAGLGPALRTIAGRIRDPMIAGLATGCTAFLLVSLGMHPLLIPEVAVAFYLTLGLTRAAAAGALEQTGPSHSTP